MEQMNKVNQSLECPDKLQTTREFDFSMRHSQEQKNWATIEPLEERKVDLSKYLSQKR